MHINYSSMVNLIIVIVLQEISIGFDFSDTFISVIQMKELYLSVKR